MNAFVFARGRRLGVAAILAAAALFVGGCASPAGPGAMQATDVAVAKRSAGTVSIAVTGGRETSASTPTQISNADFAAAIRESILSSKLFAAVMDAPAGTYALDVFITRLSQPLFGASMTATLEVTWTLSDTRTKQRVWQKGITMSDTAAWDAAFAGATRLRMATEGAARRNIEAALKEMGELDLR